MFPYNSIISKKDISEWNRGENRRATEHFSFCWEVTQKGGKPTPWIGGDCGNISPAPRAAPPARQPPALRGTCPTQRPQRHCPVAAPGSPQNSTDLETAGFFFSGGGLGEGVKNRTSVNKGVRRGRALNILTTDKAWGSFTVLLCSILLLSYLQISFFLFSLFVELLIILIEFNSWSVSRNQLTTFIVQSPSVWEKDSKFLAYESAVG